MSELPSGTVTFLFTDIEGSTRLVKQLGERYAAVLREHQRIIREAAVERGGREIDTQGDSFFFAFPRANAALGAAVVAQRALAEHEWPEATVVRVRMGLHTGEPLVGEQRYLGMGVHRAARIAAAGHGGQVLLSNATRELVEDEAAGASVRELGVYRLKDIDRPERLYQLDIEGLPTSFPPLKAERIAEPHRVSRRTLLAAALAAVLAAAVSIPIFALGQGGSNGEPLEAATGNSVGFIDTGSNDLVADVSVGTTPTDVVVAEGAVWVTNAADGTVDRIDATSRMVRQTVRVGNGPAGIAFGDGSVWVANGGSATVSRIDPASNEVVQVIPVGNGPAGVAAGRGAVWVVNRDSHTLSKINPVAGEVARTFPVGIEPLDVAVGAEGLWVTSSDGKAIRLEPRTGSVVDTVGVGRRPSSIALGAGAVWVANSLDGTVSRIDPQSSAVTTTIEVGEGPAGIAVDEESVWVADEQAAAVARIDLESHDVESIAVGGSPSGVAVGPGHVYVAVRPGSGAHRGGTLTIVTEYRTISLDPGTGEMVFGGFGLTNDGLTAFKRVGGQEGAQVVPNLAVSVPHPTDAGKTYRFRLRSGVRYSTGRPVRAEDFRHALERLFALESPDTYLYSAIEGAEACLRRPSTCDLSNGVAVDNRAGTVTFRLAATDPDLPAKLALPPAVAVPTTVSKRAQGTRPVPATGPYMVASYAAGRQVRLVRNPSFREWSRTARPDGYADEIVVKLGVAVPEQVRAVSKDEADLTIDLGFSGDVEIAPLRARFGSRVHSAPGPDVVYTFLNTTIPPFDDHRVRRALNLAVDRDAIVEALGGSDNATRTCQVLPPNYPGYETYCPYERNIDEARRLARASGTLDVPVVVWTRRSYDRFHAPVVQALRDLGYTARLRVVEDLDYYEELGRAGGKVQAGYVGWSTGLPSAAEFLQSLLGFVAETAQVSDPSVNREIRKALNLQQTDPLAANELWAGVDRMLVDRAFFVPLFNRPVVVFVSSRVGNYQAHPFRYVLLDQMWVR